MEKKEEEEEERQQGERRDRGRDIHTFLYQPKVVSYRAVGLNLCPCLLASRCSLMYSFYLPHPWMSGSRRVSVSLTFYPCGMRAALISLSCLAALMMAHNNRGLYLVLNPGAVTQSHSAV